MNWSKWASLAEIISSFAIVITLIYLTIGTKQNTDALLANSRQSTLNADLQLLSRAMDYPESAGSLGLGFGTVDEIRTVAYLISFLRIREFVWRQYQTGLMDQTNFESYMAPIQIIFESESAIAIWDSGVIRIDPGFKAYIEELVTDL